MKNRKIMLPLLLLLLGLCACGRQEELPPPPEEEDIPEEEGFFGYKLREVEISSGREAVLFQQAEEQGFLALINRRTGVSIPAELLEDPDFVNDGRYDIYKSALYHVRENGRRSKVIFYNAMPAPEKPEGLDNYFSDSRPRAFRIREDGTLIALESSYECWQDKTKNPNFQTRDRYYVRLLRENGSEISCSELVLSEGVDGLDCSSLVYLGKDLLAAPNGHGILFFGIDGQERFSVSTPLRVRELCLCTDGRLAVILEQGEERWISLIHPETREISVPEILPEGAYGFCTGNGQELLFLRNTELFRLDLQSFGTERICSLLTLGVDPVSVSELFQREDGSLHFLQNCWDPKWEQIRWRWAVATPAEEAFTGTLLTLGFSDISGTVKQAVLSFNRNQSDVLIDSVDFRNGSGTAGDVTLLVLDEEAWRIRSEAGLLADLEPWMDLTELVPAVKASLSGNSAGLTRISTAFWIESMAADAETVSGRTEWSMEELRNLLNSLPAGVSLYEPYYTSDRLFTALQRVNPEMGEDILRSFAELQPGLYDYRNYASDTTSMERRIREGRLLFLQAHVGSLDELKYYDAFFDNGACFVGWPTTSGSASRMVFDECLCLSEDSTQEQRVASGAFLNSLLSLDYTDLIYGFPVTKSELEQELNDDMNARSFRVDEDGKLILNDRKEKIEIPRSSWYSSEWRRHYVYALTQAQRDKLMTLIEHSR